MNIKHGGAIVYGIIILFLCFIILPIKVTTQSPCDDDNCHSTQSRWSGGGGLQIIFDDKSDNKKIIYPVSLLPISAALLAYVAIIIIWERKKRAADTQRPHRGITI